MQATAPTSTPPRAPAPANGRAAQSAAAHYTRIEPARGWTFLNGRELLAYRDLLVQFTLRDVSARYKQTVLGYAWAVIRPLVSMVVFTVIFGNLAGVPSDGLPYALFSFAALLPWTYFSGALTGATNSLNAQKGIFTKVYFPRLIIPLVPIMTGLVDFAIASVMLAGLMVYFGAVPTLGIVVLPLLILLMMTTALGAGLWLSSLALQYRDVAQAMGFMVQLLMYAAPVVWPASLIAERFPEHGQALRLLYGLYPMAGVIEGFRAALFGSVAMPWDLIGMGALSATCLFVTGVFVFRRMERIFADVA